jgi:predicted Rossmann-fold nucleotide-binding protein
MDALIAPEGSLELLSRLEVSKLRDASASVLQDLWRQCSVAVLNSGAEEDDVRRILERNQRFRMNIVQLDSGIALELENAPDSAFVDGDMIRGVREHLFAVMRDLLYTHDEILRSSRFDLGTSLGITDAVFHILRNAKVLHADPSRQVVVCWGGHAISREEYDYTKAVGYALGLRELDICTGCGAGAMKGPMKGATLGHAKQRLTSGRYLGLTEPTIIAAEAPNAIVRELIILPDMEKRLEAFVRMAHGIVVFPGGVGTAEEILYLLGVLSHPDNEGVDLPLVFAGPPDSRGYFEVLDAFIGTTLGPSSQARYRILTGDPQAVGRELVELMGDKHIKREHGAQFFNWQLNIPLEFQEPFEATHASMAALQLHTDQPPHALAYNLRRAFSGIVAGNVREAGIRLVEAHGPFELRGDPRIVGALGALLRRFVEQRRMKLSDPANYVPCYKTVA